MGFRVSSGSLVQGLGFWVWGLVRVLGVGFRV